MEQFKGPRRTPLEAIRNFCVIHCQNGSTQAVEECCTASCAFHPYRAGRLTPEASPRLLGVIRSKCFECVGSRPGDPQCVNKGQVRECSAYEQYLQSWPCPIWPYRLGSNPYYSVATRQARSERAKLQQHLPIFAGNSAAISQS